MTFLWVQLLFFFEILTSSQEQIGSTESCKKVLGAGFDSIASFSKRSLTHPGQAALSWAEFCLKSCRPILTVGPLLSKTESISITAIIAITLAWLVACGFWTIYVALHFNFACIVIALLLILLPIPEQIWRRGLYIRDALLGAVVTHMVVSEVSRASANILAWMILTGNSFTDSRQINTEVILQLAGLGLVLHYLAKWVPSDPVLWHILWLIYWPFMTGVQLILCWKSSWPHFSNVSQCLDHPSLDHLLLDYLLGSHSLAHHY